MRRNICRGNIRFNLRNIPMTLAILTSGLFCKDASHIMKYKKNTDDQPIFSKYIFKQRNINSALMIYIKYIRCRHAMSIVQRNTRVSNFNHYNVILIIYNPYM